VTGVVEAAAAELSAALRELATKPHEIRLHDLGDNIDPPGLVVGPAELLWEAAGPEPTTARFPVFVIVAMGERALEQLVELVQVVADRIETEPGMGVLRATPDLYLSGKTDLPAYLIETEVALT
jgi:hypothetical protein